MHNIFEFGVLAVSVLFAGCGLTVPQIGEIWDDESGAPARTLEKEIKEKIYCELENAVYYVNNVLPHVKIVYTDPKTGKEIVQYKRLLPYACGATLTLTLTVEELSALNPGVTFNTPIIPATTSFPGKLSITNNTQSYNLGLGGTLSLPASCGRQWTMEKRGNII
jgi:hypothetical protein